MSDLNNFGQSFETPGTSRALSLPPPPLNDDRVEAAMEYLAEIGEHVPGQTADLQDLVYRLTVELAQARTLLRIERAIGDDMLDENEMLHERIEMMADISGIDEDSITALMARVELAEDMVHVMSESLDWTNLLNG